MSSKNEKSLKALVARGLLTKAQNILEAKISNEGLCAVHIKWIDGHISQIEAVDPNSFSPDQILLPRLVDPHTHLDKAFTWVKGPNLKGTYEEALKTNLISQSKRKPLDVSDQAEKCLNLACANGIRAIRSHIDSFGAQTHECWEVLTELKKKWKSTIDLQFVALVPPEFWATPQGKEFATFVADANGLLGGVVVPPFDIQTMNNSLSQMIMLAEKVGCGIDLHIDESQIQPSAGIKQLLSVLDHMTVDIPITCSHSSSMGLMQAKALQQLAGRLAKHQIKIVALPLTNSWLLGRKNGFTTMQRPLAPIKQLQHAGVNVAVGGDNVQDPWFPAGNLDPIALMGFSLPIAQLAPWNRLGLAPFTTAAARLMGLEWDGSLYPGCPADLILLKAKSWAEVLSTPPERRVLINGEWLK